MSKKSSTTKEVDYTSPKEVQLKVYRPITKLENDFTFSAPPPPPPKKK